MEPTALMSREEAGPAPAEPDVELSTEARLPLESEERSRVEYLLQMSLQGQAKRARIKNIVAISNPHLSLRFQKRTHHLVSLECWVDVSQLGDSNPLQRVVSHGFDINQKGLIFTHGAITLSEFNGEQTAHKKISAVQTHRKKFEGDRKDAKSAGTSLHQLLVCQVGVGRTFCAENEEVQRQLQHEEPVIIPEGYDSLYLCNKRLDPGVLRSLESDDPLKGVGSCDAIPKHNFLIKNPDLVLPTYVVSVELDAETEVNHKCDECELRNADVYCPADRASLCERCDRTIHTSNKLISKHKRVPIADKPITDFGRCVYHPLNTVDYYCHLCQVPVCVHCKMVGSHSAGDASTHKLTEIKEAYDLALMASRKSDPFLSERKTTLTNDLSSLRAKLLRIFENADDMEREVRRRMEDVIEHVKRCAKAKASIVLSEEVDLRRQLIRIHWLEEFLSFQQRRLGPVEFLEAWGRHVRYRTELHTQEPHSGIHRSRGVEADIALKGELKISSRSADDAHARLSRAPSEALVDSENFLDDNEALKNELGLRSSILKDLDAVRDEAVSSPVRRYHSPTTSVCSMYSSAVGAPTAQYKDLVSMYESDATRLESRYASAHRSRNADGAAFQHKTPDDLVAERMRTPSCARVGEVRPIDVARRVGRTLSPTNSEASGMTHYSHVSTSKAWSEAWIRRGAAHKHSLSSLAKA